MFLSKYSRSRLLMVQEIRGEMASERGTPRARKKAETNKKKTHTQYTHEHTNMGNCMCPQRPFALCESMLVYRDEGDDKPFAHTPPPSPPLPQITRTQLRVQRRFVQSLRESGSM